MSKIKKVAVYGSCVTRDMFVSKINENYKDDFEMVLFQNHTTLKSLLSPKVKYNPSEIEVSGLSERSMQMVKDEFEKSFLDNLKDIQPDILIIDFFTEGKFKTIKSGDSFVTVNEWKTTKTKHYKKISKENEPFYPSDEEMASLMKEFTDFIKVNLKNTKVVLNKTKSVDKYKDYFGYKKEFGNKEERQKLNEKWLETDLLFESMMTEAHIINENHKYIADQEHVWGLMDVHYQKGFYKSSLKELKKLHGNSSKKTNQKKEKFSFNNMFNHS